MLQLLAGAPGVLRARESAVWRRRYRASAAVSLFLMPVASRDEVGSGFIQIEERDDAIAIQLGAGSFPERARGLNRLGFIQELIREENAGVPAECSYFAFLTSAAENSREDAGSEFAVANAVGRDGCFTSRVGNIRLAPAVTWRDYPEVTARVRAAAAAGTDCRITERKLRRGEAAPATFLYAVRAALRDPQRTAARALLYNSREFLLRTSKEADAAAGAHFVGRNLAASASGVFVVSAELLERATGKITPFRVWFELGQEHMPPLRFEYQAKSFLRLVFEADPEERT